MAYDQTSHYQPPRQPYMKQQAPAPYRAQQHPPGRQPSNHAYSEQPEYGAQTWAQGQGPAQGVSAYGQGRGAAQGIPPYARGQGPARGASPYDQGQYDQQPAYEQVRGDRGRSAEHPYEQARGDHGRPAEHQYEQQYHNGPSYQGERRPIPVQIPVQNHQQQLPQSPAFAPHQTGPSFQGEREHRPLPPQQDYHQRQLPQSPALLPHQNAPPYQGDRRPLPPQQDYHQQQPSQSPVHSSHRSAQSHQAEHRPMPPQQDYHHQQPLQSPALASHMSGQSYQGERRPMPPRQDSYQHPPPQSPLPPPQSPLPPPQSSLPPPQIFSGGQWEGGARPSTAPSRDAAPLPRAISPDPRGRPVDMSDGRQQARGMSAERSRQDRHDHHRKPRTPEKSAPPAKRRPLLEPVSPVYIPQDNAFPTFPTKKKRSKRRDSPERKSTQARHSDGEQVGPPVKEASTRPVVADKAINRSSGEQTRLPIREASNRPVMADKTMTGAQQPSNDWSGSHGKESSRQTQPFTQNEIDSMPDGPPLFSAPTSLKHSHLPESHAQAQQNPPRKNILPPQTTGYMSTPPPVNNKPGPAMQVDDRLRIPAPIAPQHNASSQVSHTGYPPGGPYLPDRTDGYHATDRSRPRPNIPHIATEPTVRHQHPDIVNANHVGQRMENQRPSTATERPVVRQAQQPRSPMSARDFDQAPSSRAGPQDNQVVQHGESRHISQERGMTGVYDDYQGAVVADQRVVAPSAIREQQIESEMPDFDNMRDRPEPSNAYQRGVDFHTHLEDKHDGHMSEAPAYAKPVYRGHEVASSDRRVASTESAEGTGFNFDVPGGPQQARQQRGNPATMDHTGHAAQQFPRNGTAHEQAYDRSSQEHVYDRSPQEQAYDRSYGNHGHGEMARTASGGPPPMNMQPMSPGYGQPGAPAPNDHANPGAPQSTRYEQAQEQAYDRSYVDYGHGQMARTASGGPPQAMNMQPMSPRYGPPGAPAPNDHTGYTGRAPQHSKNGHVPEQAYDRSSQERAYDGSYAGHGHGEMAPTKTNGPPQPSNGYVQEQAYNRSHADYGAGGMVPTPTGEPMQESNIQPSFPRHGSSGTQQGYRDPRDNVSQGVPRQGDPRRMGPPNGMPPMERQAQGTQYGQVPPPEQAYGGAPGRGLMSPPPMTNPQQMAGLSHGPQQGAYGRGDYRDRDPRGRGPMSPHNPMSPAGPVARNPRDMTGVAPNGGPTTPLHGGGRFPPSQQSSQTGPRREGTPQQVRGQGQIVAPNQGKADALPHHPAPVRPGLMDPAPAQAARPPPVRQYNMANGSAPPTSKHLPTERRASVDERQDTLPVTPGELANLRSQVDANPRDHKKAMLLVKRLVEASTLLASENGRADAKTTGNNRERYVLEAHKRLKKLAQAGDKDGQFYLADCYSSGMLGLEVDVKEAFQWYLAAAKQGHAGAAFRTAVCCEMGPDDGGGTRKDIVKAVQWYNRAAQLQDEAAMYKLGVISLKGLLGQQRNVAEAVVWLKKAADRATASNPHALHELALLYDPANMDPAVRAKVAPDEKAARELFIRGAKFGYRASQFKLGQAYEYGSLGLPVDARNSIAWYSKAASQGEHNAELSLSGWYLTGAEGILENSDTEAYLWARKAASSEPPLAKAMFAMGYYSENGIGCPASMEEAKRWYGRAASFRFPKALERLEELKKGGNKSKPKAADGRLRRDEKRDQKKDEAECTVM